MGILVHFWPIVLKKARLLRCGSMSDSVLSFPKISSVHMHDAVRLGLGWP